MGKTKLEQLQLIHQRFMSLNILHYIIVILPNLQILDNLVQFCQLPHIRSIQFLPIQRPQHPNGGSLRKMGKIDFTGIGNNIVEELRIDG